MGTDNDCLSCGRGIRQHGRDLIVRKVSKSVATDKSYPAVYRLFDRLPLCSVCLGQLPLIGHTVCPSCGRVMVIDQMCDDCRSCKEETLTMNRSLLMYTEWGKQMIKQYKYCGDERFTLLFSGLLAIAFHCYYRASRFSLVIHVPLHEERLRDRGFDQASLLANNLADHLGTSFFPLLKRVKNTDKLSKQGGRTARQAMMRDAFAIHDVPKLQKGSKQPIQILLIDDIFTTGSTVRACAAAIRTVSSYTGAEICSLTIFR